MITKTFYQCVLTSDIPSILNDVILDIDQYSKKNIRDNKSFMNTIKALCELIILRDSIQLGPLSKNVYFDAISKASDHLQSIDIKLHEKKLNKWILSLKNIGDSLNKIIKERSENYGEQTNVYK